MTTMLRRAGTAAGAAVLLLSLTAAAPGADVKWTRITEGKLSNTEEVSAVRTKDGVLHVAWPRTGTGKTEDLMHTAIAPDGTISGTPNAIVEGWAKVNGAALAVSLDGRLGAFFGGAKQVGSKDVYAGRLVVAMSDASGRNWQVPAKGQSHSTSVAALGATFAIDGRPVAAWGSNTMNLKIGVDPAQPEQKLQEGCCAYDPELARDAATGEVVAMWHSNHKTLPGLVTRTVLPALGQPVVVPKSLTNGKTAQPGQRVAITGRTAGQGIYVAFCEGYPTCDAVRLWKRGAAEPTSIAKVEAERVGIAAGPDGRIWVLWATKSKVSVVRSNKAVTRFGPVLAAGAPPAAKKVWKLAGEGSRGALDVLAHADTPEGTGTWHAQVLPPLEMKLSAVPKDGGPLTVTVTDVGDPVPGATVTFGEQAVKTGADGKATLEVPKGTKRVEITVAKDGYRDGEIVAGTGGPRG